MWISKVFQFEADMEKLYQNVRYIAKENTLYRRKNKVLQRAPVG